MIPVGNVENEEVLAAGSGSVIDNDQDTEPVISATLDAAENEKNSVTDINGGSQMTLRSRVENSVNQRDAICEQPLCNKLFIALKHSNYVQNQIDSILSISCASG